MSEQFDIAGIGNAIVDVIFPVSDDFLLEHGIAKSVMTLIDEYRAAQLISLAEDAKQVSGGSAANTMAGLASFGAKGKFIGKVRNDPSGPAFRRRSQGRWRAFDTPMADASLATACSLIAVTPDGHRSMSTFLGACRELTPDDIDASEIGAIDFLYIEGYLWDEELPKAAIRKAIAAAKGAGRSVAFTLSDPFCVGRYRDEFLHLMKTDIDILFANEEEAKALFEVDTFDAALKATKAWHGIAALTRSENGCVIVGGNDEMHVLRRRARAPGRGHDRRGRSIRGGIPVWAGTQARSAHRRTAGRGCGRRGHLALRRAARTIAEGPGAQAQLL